MLLIGVNSIILNYVTQLGGKNYWRKLRSVRVFVPKTVTVIFFGALAKEGLLKCKTPFLPPNEKSYSCY